MAPEERAEQLIGTVLPDITLATVTPPHDTWSLHQASANNRGALLVIWSSVCSHCARYDQYSNAFASNHPEITMVGVASRQGETQDDVRKAIGARQLSFPVLYDTGSAVAAQLFTQQTPRVFWSIPTAGSFIVAPSTISSTPKTPSTRRIWSRPSRACWQANRSSVPKHRASAARSRPCTARFPGP